MSKKEERNEAQNTPDRSGRRERQRDAGGDSGDEIAEARGNVTDQMRGDDAADIALAAVDELADREAEIQSIQSDLESIQAEFTTLKAELDDTKEKLLRKAAEFQNYRRRTEQERAQLIELGRADVIENLLDVLDDLRRSLEAASRAEQHGGESQGSTYDALKQGVEMVYKKFLDELKKHGVEPIEAVGQPFHEDEHEALMQREVEGHEPGMIVDEIQKGYRMGDRVIRHSKVIVAS